MNFDYMDEAVDSICKSLENEPEKWVFDVFHFNKKGCDIKYVSSCSYPITRVTDSKSKTSHEVFSQEQGVKLRKSYDIAREKLASEKQKEVLQEFSSIKTRYKKPWYKFW